MSDGSFAYIKARIPQGVHAFARMLGAYARIRDPKALKWEAFGYMFARDNIIVLHARNGIVAGISLGPGKLLTSGELWDVVFNAENAFVRPDTELTMSGTLWWVADPDAERAMMDSDLIVPLPSLKI